MRRTLILAGLTTVVMNLASFGTGATSLRPDTSSAALVSLGQEYGDIQMWAEAIAEATDTLDSTDGERARTLARQLVRVIGPLEQDFEETTASLSTSQLELVLPLWERMVFAHAGFLLLQEEAATLGTDPALDPAELRNVVSQLSAVLDFATQIQRRILEELTTPVSTPTRLL